MNRGAAAFGVVNQYYWYRMRAEIGAGNIHLDHGVGQPAETPLDRLQPNDITIAELGNGSTAASLLSKAGLL